ncbi:hypothetical protein Pcinc_035129 [Petrolisthes cinctipes]|uniref:Uncharacterized protein n=1 Tax=Petrolisthes cinctipes TaxID=88211 RepID=A0AAE1BX52_PETCI|nr:hypothetical protein Pcinc_035129 [Petrolisthes cinctipes]
MVRWKKEEEGKDERETEGRMGRWEKEEERKDERKTEIRMGRLEEEEEEERTERIEGGGGRGHLQHPRGCSYRKYVPILLNSP